jgi:hypothetical protein
MYWSSYDEAFIAGLAEGDSECRENGRRLVRLRQHRVGHAIDNAVELRGRIRPAQLAPAERP